ncbi:MAG: ATPase [Brevundimonas sp.]|nr:ATPase [Brevundimonas sp.]
MRHLLALAAAALLSVPAQAELAATSDAGFVSDNSAVIAADLPAVWKLLVAPNQWWSPSHTYSGDAANLYLDAQATGCFCEKLPKPAGAPEGQRMGSVEHMHVVYADPQRGVLRMVGGLGPLQGEAVHGVLTITLNREGEGTRMHWRYAVGGVWQAKVAEIGALVDQVLGEQVKRLADKAAPAPAAVEPFKPAE